MLTRFKNLFVRLYVAFLGRPSVWVLGVLAKSQLSSNPLIRGVGHMPFQIVDAVMGFGALRFISHVNRREPRESRESKRNKRACIRSKTLRAYLYLAIGKLAPDKVKDLLPSTYRASLSEDPLDHEGQYAFAHQLFQSGSLALACETFVDLIERSSGKFPLERRLQLLRDAGITHFMLGKIEQANRYWKMAGELRRFILGDEIGPVYRIVGSSWFAAIGHVAMLDFYSKYNKLYRDKSSRIVAHLDLSTVPGNYLCERIGQNGIDFIPVGKLQSDYDRWAKKHGRRRWDQLTEAERFAHTDDFWEFEFPDGDIWGYTHAADKIQKEWERQHRPPLLSLTEGEQKFIDQALRLLGVPDGAWYVCLHVREPGFHKGWNTLYPSMRDANIDDYLPAIDLIVQQGGWVIRMGDPSMKPLPPMQNVVDYAHSPLKTPKADILLALGCRFFFGTNSGFATIPAIYGVRCVFSNWLPIGLPLWPSQDLMLPKLFWDEKRGRHLTIKEIFASDVAFIQNWSDLPEGITLKGNTAEDICNLTAEALGMSPELLEEGLANARSQHARVAEQHGSYVGSTLAATFIRNYPSVFVE